MRALCLLVCAAPFAAAQAPTAGVAAGNPPRVLQLSLKRAVEIALTPEGSTRAALARESLKEAQGRTSEARSAFLPDVSGAVQEHNETVNLRTFGLNFQLPFGVALPTLVGPFSVFDARVSAKQSVFNLADIMRYRASRQGLSAAQADVSAANNQVSDQVARAYLAGLRAEAALETAQANVDLSQALLRLANSQKAAGTGTGIEVTRAQVQLANDQQRLIVARNDQQRAGLELLRAMGLSMDAPVELSDKLSYRPVETGDVKDLLAEAEKRRAELQAQQLRESSAKLTLRSVRAEDYPSLGVAGDYGSTGLALDASRPTRSIGVSLDVPIFDGGRRQARQAESLSQYRQESIRTRDLKQQIELDVRLAVQSLQSAQAEVQTARDGLSLAENEVAQAQRRYQAGVTNSIEVTDAQTRLDRARDNQIVALYDYNLASIDLATATGTISEYVNQ